MSNSKVKPRLPAVRITANDVIAYCGSHRQNPSIEEAARWLVINRDSIEQMMRSAIEEHMENILEDATLAGYPDPRVNEQYDAIINAIFEAVEQYASTIGKEHCGSSSCDSQTLEVVERFLEHPDHFNACMPYRNEFGDRAEGIARWNISHHTDRVHLSLEDGKLTAELATAANCTHGDDVFIPSDNRA